MKNDISKQSIKPNEKSKTKTDKTLYEKFLILGDKEVGKSLLVQNIFSKESISLVSDSIISLSEAANNLNNDIPNKNNTDDNNENISKNNNTDSKDNKEINTNENKTIKNNKDEIITGNEKEIIDIKNNSKDNIISEQKISIKNENKKLKKFQIFESSFIDNNLIHSLAFMCQCILVVFDIKNMNSFEKAKKIVYVIKSEIKLQKPILILVSTKNDQENNDKKEKKIIDNNIIMNFIDEIIQSNIDNDSLNDIIINNYMEVSNITKKGINELKTEIFNSYEKETLILTPLALSSNTEYNRYKQNNNINDLINNNLNEISGQNNPKKNTSSTSTKSKSSKENIFNNNHVANTYIKTFSPKILFKLEEDYKNKYNLNNISNLLNIQVKTQSNESNYETIKIILLGDSFVGKTSFLNQFFSEGFNLNMTSTIGINERSKIINYKENYYKIKIWDTAGQERFESIPKQYYEKMEGVFLFYDITNERSFDNILKWLKDIYECANENLIIYIIGNKVDLIGERKISFDIGNNFTRQKNMKFMEISCKLDLNISDVVYCMVYDIFRIENDCKNDNFTLRDYEFEINNNINISNRKYCCY